VPFADWGINEQEPSRCPHRVAASPRYGCLAPAQAAASKHQRQRSAQDAHEGPPLSACRVSTAYGCLCGARPPHFACLGTDDRPMRSALAPMPTGAKTRQTLEDWTSATAAVDCWTSSWQRLAGWASCRRGDNSGCRTLLQARQPVPRSQEQMGIDPDGPVNTWRCASCSDRPRRDMHRVCVWHQRRRPTNPAGEEEVQYNAFLHTHTHQRPWAAYCSSCGGLRRPTRACEDRRRAPPEQHPCTSSSLPGGG
jgi:hypothetical protein